MTLPSLALSTTWNQQRHREGEPLVTEIRALGFDAIELGQDISSTHWPGIIAGVNQGLIKVLSVSHRGPGSPDHLFTSSSPRGRAMALKNSLATLDLAAQVQARAVVLHLGSQSSTGIDTHLGKLWREGKLWQRAYTKAKVNAVAQRHQQTSELLRHVRGCLDPLVVRAQTLGLKLGLEGRSHFADFPHEQELVRLLEAYPPAVVGYWHHYGNAARREVYGWSDHAEVWRKFRDRLVGLNVHDFMPPDQDYLPLGQGRLDFSRLLRDVPALAIPVLELSPSVKAAKVLESLALWKNLQSI
jgi:sugar phosphate isomerase/epimerase